MTRYSAGLLVHRENDSGGLDVLLVHPGGPYWARKDVGAWSIPKGEYDPSSEAPDQAARREFVEELGVAVPAGRLLDLGTVTQRGGKVVRAFALRADLDVASARSNTFAMEWPPRSGVVVEYPEVDQVKWLPLQVARAKLLPAQVELLDRLQSHLEGTSG